MAAALSLSFSLKAEFKASAEEGKKLYEANNCGSCHALDKKVVGPALRGVTERRSEEWLIKWIRNNEAFRKSGDADANAIFKEYGGAAMNIFENLSPDQVKHILEYIKTAPKPTVAKTTATVAGDESAKSNSNTQYILLALIGVFAIVLIILGKVRNTLRRLAADQDGTPEEETKGSFLKGLLPEKLAKMNPTVLTVFAVLLFGGIGFVSSYKFGITEVGVQKGYAPKQPIAYSHKLHAGDLKIDCKYCHIGVEESKSATIPSLNICMNCHKGVQKASTAEGDEISPEIAKIYKALDYNPEKIGADAFGNNPKPIRWVRIHNLPDHAYFNHSQHVKVAGLACQTCHGPIEKMEVVQQWSSLQMGWCIDCHRNAGIDAANNNYYAALHEKAAKDLKDNKNKSQYFGPDGKVRITPAMNGGLECAKCHY
jgi:mono/diheme cytochrome c family protein